MLSHPSPASGLDTLPGGDPSGGDAGLRPACCSGPSQDLHGAEAHGDAVVCSRFLARSRGKAVMWEAEREKAAPHPSPCRPFSTRPPSRPSSLVPSGWQRLPSALRLLSRLGWYRGRPRPLPPLRPRPLVPSICRRKPLLRPGSQSCPEERSVPVVARAPRPPDKLAICCCLLSAFVMQIPEPAAGAEL